MMCVSGRRCCASGRHHDQGPKLLVCALSYVFASDQGGGGARGLERWTEQ